MPGRPGERLVLPLVGQHEVDIAERERRERLLGLGLDQLAAQVGRLARERPDRGDGDAEADGLERGDPAAPRDAPGGGGELGLGEPGALEQRIRVAHQDERGVGQPHAAPGRLEQRQPRLALEHGELLGDGRGRELERVGDRGDRAARMQLVQEAQSAEVEHSQATLLDYRHESELFLMSRGLRIPAMPFCLASAAAFGAMGIFGKLAYDEGATVGTLLATRFVLAAGAAVAARRRSRAARRLAA